MKKESSRTQKSIVNIVSGFGYKMVCILFPFVIKTVLIQKLGAEYLGLNSLFSSLLQMLTLSELGIGTAMTYNMYKPMAENDVDRVCALLKMYRTMYRYIGVVILGIGVLILPFLESLIEGDVPSDINIYILYLIYLTNTVLSYFLFAYKKSIWEAKQENGKESFINTIISIVMYTFQIIGLICTESYYVYIVVLPLSTFALNLLRNLLISKEYPQYNPKGNLEKDFIKNVFIKISALFGHKVGYTVINSLDSVVISSFLGLHTLAIYGNYHYILNSISGIVTVFYTSITASVGNNLVTDGKEANYKNFKTLTFINGWLVSWFSVCMLCLYQPFMSFWVGDKLMSSDITMLTFVMYFYFQMQRRIGLTYKDAAGMWKEDFAKPYIGVAVNLIGNILLVPKIGISGAIITSIIVMVVVYTPWETYVLFKYLFQRSMRDYLLKMIKLLVVTVISGAVTNFACSYVAIEGVLGLGLRGILCSIIPNMFLLMSYFTSDEFKDVMKRIASRR